MIEELVDGQERTREVLMKPGEYNTRRPKKQPNYSFIETETYTVVLKERAWVKVTETWRPYTHTYSGGRWVQKCIDWSSARPAPTWWQRLFRRNKLPAARVIE